MSTNQWQVMATANQNVLSFLVPASHQSLAPGSGLGKSPGKLQNKSQGLRRRKKGAYKAREITNILHTNRYPLDEGNWIGTADGGRWGDGDGTATVRGYFPKYVHLLVPHLLQRSCVGGEEREGGQGKNKNLMVWLKDLRVGTLLLLYCHSVHSGAELGPLASLKEAWASGERQ